MIFPLLLGAFVIAAFAVGDDRPRVAEHISGVGRRGRPRPRPPTGVEVLVACVRAGQRPPPPVISRALAEAQLANQDDLVDAIVCTYIRPVVEAAENQTTAAWPHGHGPPGPRLGQPPITPPYPYSAYPGHSEAFDHQVPPPYRGDAGPQVLPQVLPIDVNATDDDILRAIAELGAQAGAAGPGSLSEPTPEPAPPGNLSSPGGLGSPISPGTGTGPGTVTVSGRSSPIDGIGTHEWARFCDRIAREQPTYTTAYHVGQFRQRRDRLTELGIDPETVVASPAAQQVAFDRDMSEAHRRAHAAGLLAWTGHTVELPTSDGSSQIARVTTSGVLGVVQAAGIDGAIGWFRSPEDRRRFSGTTAVFNRTNGVF